MEGLNEGGAQPERRRASCKGWHRRSSERPTELYEAALRVFAEKGYRLARLEDVAHEAGVTKALIYHYFEGKEDLFLQTLAHRRDAFFDDVREEVEHSGGAAAERIRCAMRLYLERWKDPRAGNIRQLMLGDLFRESRELFHKWLASGAGRRWELVEELVREGQANGEFRQDVWADAVASFLVTGLSHLCTLHCHYGVLNLAEGGIDEAFLDNVELVLRGLAVNPEECA